MKLQPGIILLTLSGCFIISCNQFDIGTAGDRYYYYPSKNVYYDVKRSNFIYSLDSGKTWDSMYSETPNPAITGKRELVYNTNGEVWKDNEAHRQLYNGTLLNIINEESLKKPDPLTKKFIERNTPNISQEPQKKERKRPIKKFFQKLFGKKKDTAIN